VISDDSSSIDLRLAIWSPHEWLHTRPAAILLQQVAKVHALLQFHFLFVHRRIFGNTYPKSVSTNGDWSARASCLKHWYAEVLLHVHISILLKQLCFINEVSSVLCVFLSLKITNDIVSYRFIKNALALRHFKFHMFYNK
jgi:hypothetical protein